MHPARSAKKLRGIVEVYCSPCQKWVGISVPDSSDIDTAYELVVDLQQPLVSYKGYQIPTTPPYNIQPQPLRALYVLAKSAGLPLKIEEIWEQMETDGLLSFADNKPSSLLQPPETKHLKQSILKPIKKALHGYFSKEEIDHLLETVSNPQPSRLRLNIPPEKVRCVGLQK